MSSDTTTRSHKQIVLIKRNNSEHKSSPFKNETMRAFQTPAKMNTEKVAPINASEPIVGLNKLGKSLQMAAVVENDIDSVICHPTKQSRTMKQENEAREEPATENDESNAIISDTSDSSTGDSDGYQSSISSLNDENDSLDDDWDLPTTQSAKVNKAAEPAMKWMSPKRGHSGRKRPYCSGSFFEKLDIDTGHTKRRKMPIPPPMRPGFLKTGAVGPICARPSLPGRDFFFSPSGQSRVCVKSNTSNEWPFSTIMASGKISLIHFDHKKNAQTRSKEESNRVMKGDNGKRPRGDANDTPTDILDVALTMTSWLPQSTAHPSSQAEGTSIMPLCLPGQLRPPTEKK